LDIRDDTNELRQEVITKQRFTPVLALIDDRLYRCSKGEQ
jgi:hypothetical protein